MLFSRPDGPSPSRTLEEMLTWPDDLLFNHRILGYSAIFRRDGKYYGMVMRPKSDDRAELESWIVDDFFSEPEFQVGWYQYDDYPYHDEITKRVIPSSEIVDYFPLMETV